MWREFYNLINDILIFRDLLLRFADGGFVPSHLPFDIKYLLQMGVFVVSDKTPEKFLKVYCLLFNWV
jgi:hypothetical protein